MIKGKNYTVHIGNNLDILPTLESNSVDSIVTDPPYELGFMGKKWDSSGIAYNVELWRECLRVLKPGGHMLAFGGSRTWHRIAVAIEDAGFEVRDSIAWMYGSGFPKSLDISKAIDKAAGAEREVVGLKPDWVKFRLPEIDRHKQGQATTMNQRNREIAGEFYKTEASAGYNNPEAGAQITAPATPEAKQWEGWGTALKPAFEPVIVARKPLDKGMTVAENVLTYGTGGLNIDGSRIAGNKPSVPQPKLGVANGVYEFGTGEGRNGEMSDNTQGRWPSNVILDPYTAELLDEQSGISQSKQTRFQVKGRSGGILGSEGADRDYLGGHNDSGGASRFFYVAKASKRDRNEGLEEPEDVMASKFAQDKWTLENMQFAKLPTKNFHPTVKPTTLMEYLIKLVTPPNGLVLDPFTGSGSTGKAALLNGFRFVGCELTEDYIPIIEGRLNHAESVAEQKEQEKDEALF